jgi:glycine reductase
MNKIRVVHYINQFFAGIGGEDFADHKPEIREGKVGPGMGLANFLGENAEIVATVVCGDSYFNENLESAKEEILNMIKAYEPDMFIAGPAFNAGRYGTACGSICKEVNEKLNIPVLTGMYIENPGADMFKKDLYIISTGNSAASMRDALPALGKLGKKLYSGEEIGSPSEDGYLPRGIRRNVFLEENGASRAVDMLVKKLKGDQFKTEYPMPVFDNVSPGEKIIDIKKAKIALVTSGGIVPKGNPDRIESSSASKFGKYDIDKIEALSMETYETAHGGYDPVYANDDPNRVLPVDVLRDMEKSNEIGQLHRYYYSTVGNGTSVNNSKAYAAEIAKELINDGVEAVILTST